MVDSILASANRVPRVLLAHAKNTTRVLRGPIRLPIRQLASCPRTVLYVCVCVCVCVCVVEFVQMCMRHLVFKF